MEQFGSGNQPNYAEWNKAQGECIQAIYNLNSQGLKEGLIHASTGFGKTTIYVELTKTSKAPCLINLAHNDAKDILIDELQIEYPKHTIDISTSDPKQLTQQIEGINSHSILLSTYVMLNRLHKEYPELYNKLFDKLGSFEDLCYIHSDEAHRGIGNQTISAMKEITQQDPTIGDDEGVTIDEYDDNMHQAIQSRNLCHLLWTATPTYSHKSVKNHFNTIYRFTKQQSLEYGVNVPIQNIRIGEGLQYITTKDYSEKDLVNGYKKYFLTSNDTDNKGVEHNMEILVGDAVAKKVAYLHQQNPIKGIGACANIKHLYEMEQKYNSLGIKTYIVHSGNQIYKSQGSLLLAKQLIEKGVIEMILVCNKGMELLNIPCLNLGAIHYAISSPVKLDQFIGRISRRHPSKSYTQFICPDTKIIYENRTNSNTDTLEKSSQISNTVGHLHRQDMYYTLGDFSIEYLNEHGLTYVSSYKDYLDNLKSKRELIEAQKEYIFNILRSKINADYNFNIRTKEDLISILGLANKSDIIDWHKECGILILIDMIIFNKSKGLGHYMNKSLINKSNDFTVLDLKDLINYNNEYDRENLSQEYIDKKLDKIISLRGCPINPSTCCLDFSVEQKNLHQGVTLIL